MYKVILLDDDKTIRNTLKKCNLWEEYGFVIEGEANDGREALEKIMYSHFDIAFVDINIPRIDGIKLLRQLNEMNNNLCVVILSKYYDFNYVRQGIILGVFDYVLKPISNEELRSILSRAKTFLDKKQEEKIMENKLSELFEESVKILDFKNDVIKILKLMTYSPNEALSFTYSTLENLISFYGNDTKKIEILLNRIVKYIRKTLLEKAPWLEYLNLFKDSLNINADYSNNLQAIIDKFILSLKEISSIANNFYLYNNDSLIRQFCEYILEHCDEKISLSIISKEFGYSRSYIGKLFKQKTGQCFLDYVTKVKMEKAKALILTGKYKNYEISSLLGYNKVDYFSSLFKKYTGKTPAEYKQSCFSNKKIFLF